MREAPEIFWLSHAEMQVVVSQYCNASLDASSTTHLRKIQKYGIQALPITTRHADMDTPLERENKEQKLLQ